jgi:hypothetical protein
VPSGDQAATVEKLLPGVIAVAGPPAASTTDTRMFAVPPDASVDAYATCFPSADQLAPGAR